MKRTILCVFCALLLLSTMLCVVSAEETSQDATTETTVTTTVDVPTTDTTLDDTTTTESDPTSTTTEREYRLRTSMTMRYADRLVTVHVVDENGMNVRSAPITLTADDKTYSATTNDMGIAKITLTEEPAEIFCAMAEFQGSLFLYEACGASVVLRSEPSTEPTSTTGSTQSTGTRRPLGSTRTLTTTDPAQGDVTQIITITETTLIPGTSTQSTTAKSVTTAVPKNLILALIVGGALLLIAAALLTYFFLIRTPKSEPKAPANEKEVPPVEPTATVVDLETDLAEPVAEEPSVEKPASNKSVRLEDLFKGE